MTIPFLDLFKKFARRSTPVAEAPGPVPVRMPRPKKPAGERLSKTVLPNSTRSFSPPDPFRAAAGASSSPGASLQIGPRKITAAPATTRSPSLPPALARALEPKLERTISLRIADFIERVPTGYIKPVEILDTAARVSLKASEIEKGMEQKQPTISLPSLYQQVPEIFLRSVRPDDDTRVLLPYEKVLEQVESLHVREDQVRDPAVPQLDTPILKATVQDSERFGTKIEPIESSPLPPVPVEPATAKAIAAAEPDAVVHRRAKDRSASSGRRVISLHSPELKPKSELSLPKNIPSDLSPNGTGASASERVPASSGPPVPTTLPFAPELAKAVLRSPVEAPKLLPSEPPSTKPMKLTSATVSESAKDAPKIALSLKPILQGLPAFQLNDDIAAIGDDERIEFPLSLIEPQLAAGRISISPEAFRATLPEKYRHLFQIDEAGTPVSLPLEEVLKNLPATVLKLREDQEQPTLDKDFETPFSIKAQEDAERLPVSASLGMETSDKSAEKSAAQASSSDAEGRVDPKEIIAQANVLPGVKACAITFADGLNLAGNLPNEVAADGLCAMAPSLLERVEKHMRESKLGQLISVTLHSADSAISFFASGNIFLTALHAEGALTSETRAQLAGLVEKLSRTYAK